MTSHYLNQWRLVYCRIYASLSYNNILNAWKTECCHVANSAITGDDTGSCRCTQTHILLGILGAVWKTAIIETIFIMRVPDPKSAAVKWFNALQWCHNGRDGVPNHQPLDCLLNRVLKRRSKKTSKLCVTGLCAGNSPVTGEFPAQMASNAENVSIWWRHHGTEPSQSTTLRKSRPF